MRDRSRRGDEGSDSGSVAQRAPGKRTLSAQLARRGEAAATPGDIAQATVDGKGAGAAVPSEVRTVAESHLGADVSAARVHGDDQARAGADALGARAFAYGTDIFLGSGESDRDVGLMAHELTHVVQQGGASPAPMAKLDVGAADTPAEREADAVGAAAAAGPRSRGAIVDDGATPGPDQQTRGQLVASIRAAVETELAALPPEQAAPQREALDAQLAGADAAPAAEVERRLAAELGPSPTAAGYVAAARNRARAAAAPATGLGAGIAATGAIVDAAASALGTSMAGVALHTGPEAAQLAAREGAQAVTVGRHVAFAAGAYAPGTLDGDALLAHELTHVAQQDGAAHGDADVAAVVQRKRGDDVDEAGDEQHADSGAAAILARVHGGDPDAVAAKRGSSGLSLRRCQNGAATVSAAQRAQQQALLTELDQVIADGQWEVIRARVYPREAAAARTRHRERRAGRLPDLAGLGSVVSIDRMVAALRALQAGWGGMTVAARGAAVFAAANAELAAAGVPTYLDTAVEDMVPRGSFAPDEWKFRLRRASIDSPALSDAEAAEVANTAQHESRHCEQHFLQGRILAGRGRTAAQIAADTDMPIAIARRAFAAPLRRGDARFVEGEVMAQAMGPDQAAHQATSNQVTIEQQELARRRTAAQNARTALAASVTPATLAAAQTARDALRAQITTLETAYLAYRAIPYEADAHEVGDSTTEAFLGGP